MLQFILLHKIKTTFKVNHTNEKYLQKLLEEKGGTSRVAWEGEEEHERKNKEGCEWVGKE